MSTTEPKKPRKPRAPRRNFATERGAVIQYLRISIDVLKSWDISDFSDTSKSRIDGKLAAYAEILKQMGETE